MARGKSSKSYVWKIFLMDEARRMEFANVYSGGLAPAGHKEKSARAQTSADSQSSLCIPL